MRWKTAWGCVLLLAGTLGCPHAFGRGGTIDRASHKDLMEMLKDGPCSDADIKRFCSPGRDLETCLNLCD
jgi:hypothetical protein